MIWFNTIFLVAATIITVVMVFKIAGVLRDITKVLARIEDTAARSERISLAVLERVFPQQGSQA